MSEGGEKLASNRWAVRERNEEIMALYLTDREMLAKSFGNCYKSRLPDAFQIDDELVIVDCRPMNNPDLKDDMKGHTGYYLPSMSDMMAQQSYEDTLTEAIQELEKALSNPRVHNVVVLCVCKSGNHRSVCMSWQLERLLDYCRILRVVTMHTSRNLCRVGTGELEKIPVGSVQLRMQSCR